jgi:hypothetical protein
MATDSGDQEQATGRGDESTMGYFRRVYEENPRWLKSRSNDLVLQRWLEDHPWETEVPKRVKVGLQNIKSLLRRKRRRGKRQPVETQAVELTPEQTVPENPNADLEELEARIDDALLLARKIDREELDNVIRRLRAARNEVVWKLGQ